MSSLADWVTEDVATADVPCRFCGELNIYSRRGGGGAVRYDCHSCQNLWWEERRRTRAKSVHKQPK